MLSYPGVRVYIDSNILNLKMYQFILYLAVQIQQLYGHYLKDYIIIIKLKLIILDFLRFLNMNNNFEFDLFIIKYQLM